MPASKRFKRETRREILRLAKERRATEAGPTMHPVSQDLARAFDKVMALQRKAQNPKFKKELMELRSIIKNAMGQADEAQLFSHYDDPSSRKFGR